MKHTSADSAIFFVICWYRFDQKIAESSFGMCVDTRRRDVWCVRSKAIAKITL